MLVASHSDMSQRVGLSTSQTKSRITSWFPSFEISMSNVLLSPGKSSTTSGKSSDDNTNTGSTLNWIVDDPTWMDSLTLRAVRTRLWVEPGSRPAPSDIGGTMTSMRMGSTSTPSPSIVIFSGVTEDCQPAGGNVVKLMYSSRLPALVTLTGMVRDIPGTTEYSLVCSNSIW